MAKFLLRAFVSLATISSALAVDNQANNELLKPVDPQAYQATSAFDLNDPVFYDELRQLFMKHDKLNGVTTTLHTSSTYVNRTWVELDELLFNTSMPEFLAARAAQNPPYFRWSSDGCTVVDDHPHGFNFHDSCVRHDIGYGNYRLQLRCDMRNRERIDSLFYADLKTVCDKEHDFQQLKCQLTALTYWAGVRALGGIGWCDGKWPLPTPPGESTTTSRQW